MEKTFFKGEHAYWLVSNEGGKEVFVEVEVLAVNVQYGRTRYLFKPVSGKGQASTEKLSKIK